MNSLNISEDNPQNNINNSNISIYGNNQIRNYSDNKAPTVKIPRDMPTKSLQIRKVVSNVLFGIGAVAAAVAIAAAVASLAFAVAFLPLAAIVGIGIASVALLTIGTILRLKKDTLSEENLPEVIKLLAEKNENYIKSNVDFVNKVIELCGRNEILGKLIDEECGQHIESLIKTFENPNTNNANKITEELKSIKKNYDLIQSISFLKEGEKVYDAGKEEADFQNITLPLQKNNDIEALDETISFFENQQNKLNELAGNHTCGIIGLNAVFDNKGTILKFEKDPNGAFLSPKEENNVDKKSGNIEDYDVNLNGIEDQSKKDFNQPVILIIDNKEINIDNKEIKTENLDDLEKKIRENFSNNEDKIIKKILSFPGQSCCEFNLAIQSFFFNKKGRNIVPKTETIQFKIEITNDDVYLYACSKYKIFNGNSSSYEPFCIEESKKYRLNDQEEGKYIVPTLLAEHIAVFEATPHVTEEGNLAYLEIGEKKSEFNWINPKPEELVTFDVKKDAVNNEKK